jgi:hypothetical protein
MLLSIPGLVRTILIVVAVIVILRFIGQLMNAKRNINDQNALNREREREQEEKKNYEKNKGRTIISNSRDEDAEDADYEEIP